MARTSPSAPETEFTVSISAHDLDYVYSIDVILEYNPDIIEVLDVNGGEFSDPDSFFGIAWGIDLAGDNMQIMMSVSCDFICVGDGELASVVFTTKDVTGSTNIDMVDVKYYLNFAESYPGETGDSALVTVSIPDTVSPLITIESPADTATYEYTALENTLVIGGSASDDVSLMSISYSVNTGDSGLAIGTETWSVEVSLVAGENIITITATDTSDNTATDILTVNYTEIVPDTTAPLRSAGSPSGSLDASSGEVTLSVTTDENATCYYSTNPLTIYGEGTVFENTGSTNHSSLINGLSTGASHSYYIRCADESENQNEDDYQISFSINSVNTGGGSSGGGSSSGGASVPSGGGASPIGPTTPAQPPLDVENFQVIKSENEYSITWENPTDSEFIKVIIVKSFKSFSSETALEDVLKEGSSVYEGTDEVFIDYNANINQDIYYYIYVNEVSGRTTQSASMFVKRTTPIIENEVGGNDSVPNSIEVISDKEAKTIKSNKQRVEMKKENLSIYEKITKNRTLDQNQKYNLAFFIENGTESTKKLGAGERAGVIDSYYKAFGKLPSAESDWMDIIKIANGRWPNERNTDMEQKNINEVFSKIYKRAANMDNPHDNAAITIITYGLRPADRNMESEKNAIKFFKGIFGHQPESAENWDIVRAIAYSGATR